MGAKVHNVSSSSGGANFRKKRKMAAREGLGDAATATPSPTSPIGNLFADGASESARRRWRLLQKHVCITRWLSKDLMQRHLKRFALSQQSIVDAVMYSKDDFMEVFVKIREQFLSLLDAENCFIIFEAKRSLLEFDGRTIYPSARAKKGLLQESLRSGQPLHLSSPTSCENAQIFEGISNIDIRSYVCIPLIDGDNNVQAVVEIFNSRYDARVINSWLSDSANGSLHVFRNFVGKIIKAFAKRNKISEIVSSSASSALHTRHDESSNSTSSSYFVSDSTSSTSVQGVDVFVPSHSASSPRRQEERRGSAAAANEVPIESLVDLLRQTIVVEQCVVYAYDKESNMLWSRLSESSSCCPATVSFGEGVIGKAALTGEPIHLTTRAFTSLTPSSVVADVRELTASLGLPSAENHDVLIIPTFNGNQQLNGVVLLRNKKDETGFNESDVAIGINICRHIGNTLHSSELHEAILKAQGKAQTLLDLSAVLFRELETNSLLLAIMDAIKKPMSASKCSMFLMNEEQSELYSPVGSDISCDLAQEGFRISVTSGIIGAAAMTGEVINVPDAYLDSRFNQAVDKQTGFVTRSILAVPIKDANGKVLGVLEMVNKLSKQYFDKDDEELARGIAYYVAIALNNARLFEEARSAMRRSDALLALMQVMSSTNENVGDVFKALVETICQILNVEHGELFFVDSLSKSLFCRTGLSWKGYSIPVGKYIQGIVAEKGEVVNLVNAAAHPEFNREYDRVAGIKTRNLLCVPVKSSQRHGEENVIAVFYAANKVGKSHARFCDEDIKILVAICAELKSIIERRAWELVFEADGSEGTQVTSSFLSQYTSTPTLSRRRSHASLRSSSSTGSPAAVSTPVLNRGLSDNDPRIGSSASFSDPASVSNAVNAHANNASAIRSWDLEPWEYSTPQLVDFVMDMFEYYDLLTRFRVPRATMRRFIVSVKSQYQDIPYHNFYHAFATLHVSFMIVSSQPDPLKQTAALASGSGLAAAALSAASQPASSRSLFEARDLLAIFVAAFCHDMNHNGRTNDFHISYRTSIAMLYNDQSVLENMHAAACFDTMRRPGHDILEHMDAGEYRHVRKSIIRAILATDMHNHAGIVSQLHEKLKSDVFNSDDETHKELLINAIVHSADISGPALTESAHLRWSLQLLHEFNMQYDEEVALGMTPTLYMNAKPCTPAFCKLNIAFIDSCVFPLWGIMNTFLDGLGSCITNIQTNRVMWTAREAVDQV
ncbi:3'5'-cyclic nucleotide phosphodiesterase [Globisporangium polare]